MIIPPLAFVAWTMLQRAGVLATQLAYKADKKSPPQKGAKGGPRSR